MESFRSLSYTRIKSVNFIKNEVRRKSSIRTKTGKTSKICLYPTFIFRNMNSKQGKKFAFARLAALIQRMDFHFDLHFLSTQDLNCCLCYFLACNCSTFHQYSLLYFLLQVKLNFKSTNNNCLDRHLETIMVDSNCLMTN